MEKSNVIFESYNAHTNLKPDLNSTDLSSSSPNPEKLLKQNSSSSTSSPSESSSSNSSILEFQIPKSILGPSKSSSSTQITGIFSSSSPIPSKKALDPSDFHSKSSKNEKTEKFIQSDSSDEETRNYLQVFDEVHSKSSLSSEGNLELNEAIVVNNEDSQSSSSENGEIFKDLYEESQESPEKLKTEDFYTRVNDSPIELKHQAISLMSNGIIDEKVKDKKVYVLDNEEKSRQLMESDGEVLSRNKENAEKEGMSNSLTDEIKPKRETEDPKGSSTCCKCYIL